MFFHVTGSTVVSPLLGWSARFQLALERLQVALARAALVISVYITRLANEVHRDSIW